MSDNNTPPLDEEELPPLPKLRRVKGFFPFFEEIKKKFFCKYEAPGKEVNLSQKTSDLQSVIKESESETHMKKMDVTHAALKTQREKQDDPKPRTKR